MISVYSTKQEAQTVCNSKNKNSRRYQYHVQALSNGGFIVLVCGKWALA
jgi:hypothetical protein